MHFGEGSVEFDLYRVGRLIGEPYGPRGQPQVGRAMLLAGYLWAPGHLTIEDEPGDRTLSLARLELKIALRPS